MDQPGKVANPARGQLNRENIIPLSLGVPENLYHALGQQCYVGEKPTVILCTLH